MKGVEVTISEAGALLSFMSSVPLGSLTQDRELAMVLAKLIDAKYPQQAEYFTFSAHGKVQAIKITRALTGLGLKEAKDLVDEQTQGTPINDIQEIKLEKRGRSFTELDFTIRQYGGKLLTF